MRGAETALRTLMGLEALSSVHVASALCGSGDPMASGLEQGERSPTVFRGGSLKGNVEAVLGEQRCDPLHMA